MLKPTRLFVAFAVLLGVFVAKTGAAQRTYKPSSVLATGTWYRVSTDKEGMFKMDAAFLSALGLGANLPSAQIRVFAGDSRMLPEAADAPRVDDLEEMAVSVEDGGDGTLSGNDYLLFYSPGPHRWYPDSAAQRFVHQKNLYTERLYYYISVGGNGKRVASVPALPVAAITVTSFNERYFSELDSLNLLSSGREWWGEELSNLPGRNATRQFTLPLSDLLPGASMLVTSAAARSLGNSQLAAAVNNGSAQSLSFLPVGTAQYDLFARTAQQTDNVSLSESSVRLAFTFLPGSGNSQAWINWFRFFARRSLNLSAGGQLGFRDWTSVGNGSVNFQLTGATAATQVWDVTTASQPQRLATSLSGSSLQFTADASRLREYIAFGSTFLQPTAEGRVANQNLHARPAADYFIITAPEFLPQAQRLAQFHQQRAGMAVKVVTTQQVYNEFSGGIPDPTALRDFVKMHFDSYRATWSQKPKYLLLFGRASFDFKNRIQNNTNFVPGYQSPSSLDPLSTYTSDDFFGFLEDAEDINSSVIVNNLDVGIGRVPAKNIEEAKSFVDKVIDYHSPQAFGPWRTSVNLIADDEDGNLHLQDAEVLSSTVTTTAPFLNQQKIYLDAFQQESGSAGGRYPGANALINTNIYNGTLIWNYSGHGGPERLAEEVVIDQGIVNNWNNPFRLPLFITATCDFAPFDAPISNSLGENLLLRPKTGAIALMTTTRVVFANSNRILNNNYLSVALKQDTSGRYLSLGEAVQASKNLTYATSGDVVNNRKFALLGDPAMTLAFPALQVVATELNGRNISAQPDTLSATELVTMSGEVRSQAGTLQTGFSGTVHLTLFDKPRSITTLANDPTSLPVAYPEQNNVLFRGKATATGGRFQFKFRMPKDINYQFGAGKMSLYAQNGSSDGAGISAAPIIGGVAAGGVNDTEGPQIKAFLNDTRFVNGGLANAAPVLLLNLSDSSGINTGGTGIDHDLVATLDGNNNQYFILNNFYESDINSYQQGTVRFQLPALAPGPHTLHIKAWDVVNNSNETELNFTVVNNEELRIDRVLNYPNPFTTQTAFWFEHNQPGVDLRARVDIYTVSGRRIKTISQTINTPGNRSIELTWDGRDEWGDKPGRGVYLYLLSVRTPTGQTVTKWERLALF